MDAEGVLETRRSRACIECSSKKLRCVPSEEDAQLCRRCHRLGKECLTRRDRPRRFKVPLVGRIEQLERRVSELLNGVSENASVSSSTLRAQRGSHSPSTLDPFIVSSPPSTIILLNGMLNHDIFDMKLLTLEQAQSLCQRYRHIAEQNFPYVILPADFNVASMRIRQPMLLMAVLAVATWRQRSLQLVLEQEYLRNLSSRVFIQGKRSLDILQSLLIYLGWHHHFLTAQRQETYRLGTLTAMMAIELGLDRGPKDRKSKGIGTALSTCLPNPPPDPAIPQNMDHKDARRALIGSYMITTWSAMIERKSYTLPWTTYIEECALSLATEPEVHSDSILPHYLRSIRIIENMNTILSCDDPDQPPRLLSEYISVCVGSIEDQLQSWKNNLPFAISDHASFDLTYHFIDAYIHGAMLCNGLADAIPVTTRAPMLTSSMRAIESYFTRILSNPARSMTVWTSIAWGRLVSVLMLLDNISGRIGSLDRTSEPHDTILRLQSLVKELHPRIKGLMSLTNTPQNHEHWFQGLAKRLETFQLPNQGHKTPGDSDPKLGHTPANVRETSAAGDIWLDRNPVLSRGLSTYGDEWSGPDLLSLSGLGF